MYYSLPDQYEAVLLSLNSRGYRESNLKQRMILRRKDIQQNMEKHSG